MAWNGESRMKTLATLAVALLVVSGGQASAASCRDGKGKFVPCPPPSAAAATKCRNAAGKFIKCGTAAAAPK